jgi:hypothetical protein
VHIYGQLTALYVPLPTSALRFNEGVNVSLTEAPFSSEERGGDASGFCVRDHGLFAKSKLFSDFS